MPKIKSKISTFSATPRDLEMLEVVARYHGTNKSATIVSLVRASSGALSPAAQTRSGPIAGPKWRRQMRILLLIALLASSSAFSQTDQDRRV
jgi:hypothetical protein